MSGKKDKWKRRFLVIVHCDLYFSVYFVPLSVTLNICFTFLGCLTVTLTYDEEYLHCDVADGCAARQVVVVADEADVVGHRHGNVEGGEQYQPIPASFERAVVKQDEFRFLGICHLVLWQSGRIPEHILDRVRKPQRYLHLTLNER